MHPKHTNPTRPRLGRDGRQFWAHAPYNFVPLPEQVITVSEGEIPGHDIYEHYTGYIECVLTTLTPLYTRSVMNVEFFRNWGEKAFWELPADKQNERAAFFSLDDAERPVIPGSGVRGMLRALVEIAGYGKVQWLTNEPMAFRAVGDTTSLGRDYRDRLKPLAIQAGYLERQGSGWQIRPAQPIGGKPFARIKQDNAPNHGLKKWKECQNAWYIYVPVTQSKKAETWPLISKASPQSAPGLVQAVLVRTGPMQNKRRDFVFGLPNASAASTPIPNEVIRIYRNQITEEQKKLLGEEGALREMQPVFYLAKEGRVAFFGHAMMFRLPYSQAPLHLLPEKLRRPWDIDLAEAIFGYVPQGERTTARAGRVFFTDARYESATDGIWLTTEPITPKILAEPKPTTFQHYVVQDKDEGHNPDNKDQLAHYNTPTPSEAVIRGHKLYWHAPGELASADFEESDLEKIKRAPKQYTRIKPVKSGVTFRCRIYFENLSEVELGALLWALTLPGEADKTYRHKIGMGKPLGLGSVHIQPVLYLSDRKNRYGRLFGGEGWNIAISQEQDLQTHMQTFETWVLEGMDQAERSSAQSLRAVNRISMLLKMLEWPGPDRSLTQYMTIEPNEYKERPVLPDPLNIAPPPSAVPPLGQPTTKTSRGKQRVKSKGKRSRR